MPKPLSLPAQAGQAAARSLLTRMAHVNAPDETLRACAAWALSHFRPTRGFERAFLATLALEWHEQPQGGIVLRETAMARTGAP